MTADTRDLHKLAQDLRGADRKLEREMKREMAALGEPIRQAVVREASWSKRIGPATKVNTRFTKRTQNVIVTVNRNKAPHARPLENNGESGTFQHPTPNGGVATQQARPFFGKAVTSQDHRIDKQVNEAAERWERRLGFKGAA